MRKDAQGLGDRGAVAVRLDECLDHRPDLFEAGAKTEVFKCCATLGQEGKFCRRQHEFFRQWLRLGCDFVGDTPHGKFHRHTRFDTDQEKVECIRPGATNGSLTLGDGIGDDNVRRVEAQIGETDRKEETYHQRFLGKVAEPEDVDEGDEQKQEGQAETRKQEGIEGIL
ncbi:hypothetical protein D9M72_505910 [compost metagenome]